MHSFSLQRRVQDRGLTISHKLGLPAKVKLPFPTPTRSRSQTTVEVSVDPTVPFNDTDGNFVMSASTRHFLIYPSQIHSDGD
jgi:hypothetical protein